MGVPLLDLNAQFKSLEADIRSAIDGVLQSQHFIMGEEVSRLEKELSVYLGTSHVYGCASGSDALLLALMCIDLQPGDLVITSPYTFFATGGAIARLGAVPVFLDVSPEDFNLNPVHLRAFMEGKHPLNKRFDRRKVKVVIPVYLYGQVAKMTEIVALSAEYNIVVVEDAAQSIGSLYEGKQSGTMGQFGCYSFFPSKNLGAYGDGGLLTVNEEQWAQKAAIMRLHGAKPKYHHKYIGINSRLDTLQAAILLAKLPHLSEWNNARRTKALRYNELFTQAGVVTHHSDICGEHCACLGSSTCDLTLKSDKIVLPKETTGNPANGGRHVYHQYVIRTHRRDELIRHLNEHGIGNAVYYPVPLHEQECFSYLGYTPTDCPVSSCMARQSLALPMYPELTDAQQQEVVQRVVDFLHQ